VVGGPAAQVGRLVPPGLAPLGDLQRRLPPREARDVVESADGPVALVEVLELGGG
jgi:hypothetical protein